MNNWPPIGLRLLAPSPLRELGSVSSPVEASHSRIQFPECWARVLLLSSLRSCCTGNNGLNTGPRS